MSGSKAVLKAIGAAVKAQKYDDATQEAQRLLASDPQNYQASIFLGFALAKLNRLLDAEKAYEAAIETKASDPQAWQGLIQVYERQDAEKLALYHKAVLNLAAIYQRTDDKYKCQNVVDKFLEFVKTNGTHIQYKKAQEIVLPTSPIYGYLEGRIPQPAHTYKIMAQITEFEEKERINKEIGERRTRLGAKIGQVTAEVNREVLRCSDLEELYAHIIDWSDDDNIRRQYEEKLLQRCLEVLVVLPVGPEKSRKCSKVLKLATDMVIIKHPFKLAWDIKLEWEDPKDLHELDVNFLREYCAFFPTVGLAQVLRGYMSSEISQFPAPLMQALKPKGNISSEDSEDDDDGGGVPLDRTLKSEDRLLVMTEGMSDAGKSILAHRLMGEYYQYLEEYEMVVELMRNGQRLVLEESNKTGLKFESSMESISALLGTALVFYQSPRNHPEAKAVFNNLLKRNPTSAPALIGIGLIYKEEEDYITAIEFLGRALERERTNIRVKTEAAWVKALNGDFVMGKSDLEECLPEIEGNDLQSRDLLAQTLYRIGVCLWNIDTSRAGRKDRNGAYSYFLAALKSNLNFAPAYTSLGIFYADYSKDKKRSRKCFQKAFELSSSEIEAAERLARIFADQGEWDLVEVVAQRVVESGKVRPAPGSKKKGISWPFAALGVAELNRQEYSKSIISFQSALRIKPDDHNAWVGLGESYHSSGRYIAAMKALQQAEKFETEDENQKCGENWLAKHMLANVKRELGDYDEAIAGYQGVLRAQPCEFGVAIALIQCLVEAAWDGIERGLFSYATGRATEAIDEAFVLSTTRSDAFDLWRAVGDSCSVFSFVQGQLLDFPASKMKQLLQSVDGNDGYEYFSDVDGVGVDVVFANGLFPDDETNGLNLTRCLHASILAHKQAIHVSALDSHAQAVAYYNLGWAEYRAHRCLCDVLKKKSTRYLKAAVRCFKRSIELEARNHDFWNALGVVTSEINPHVAQHSFVRSLYLSERSAQTWTNLGTLYLLQSDYELANEAFTRAQSSDPDFAHAWIGQGLLALLFTQDEKEAHLLFTHAMEVSGSSSLVTKRQYAQSTFDQLLSAEAASNLAHVVQPIFALKQLESMVPSDLAYRHLSGLFFERVEDVPSALEVFSKICAAVEADYEVTESPESLSCFTLAKADLARSQLTVKAYEDAAENGEMALQLSTEDAGNKLSTEARKRCRLSAHLTLGLAQYYLGNVESALQYFVPALEESNNNPDAVCLLVQVLWAKGDVESRGITRGHLLDCVENYPDHVRSLLLLGVIALLENDEDNLEAVAIGLREMRATVKMTELEQTQVGEILRAMAALSKNSTKQEIVTEIQTEILLHPGQRHSWSCLSDLEEDFAADMALMMALKVVPPKGALEAAELSRAYAATGKIGDAQKAIMNAPWINCGWASLTAAVSAR